MAESNHSAVTELILLGLTDNPELQFIFFCILLLIYLLTSLGNLGLIVLIQVSPQLHTPMKFFLCHLAFVDSYGSSIITPNTLVNSFREIKSVLLCACATRVCGFITFSVWKLLMLTVMVYDLYVAICHPLLFAVLMPRKLYIQMVTSSYIYGFLVGFIQAVATFHMAFCDPNVINQFYCDDAPLIALACSDTQVKELMLLVIAGFKVFCSLLIVLISYVFIIFAIVRIHSAVGRQKAFSTCASHLFSITMYHGTLSFMYLQPKSSHSLDKDKFASVFYDVVIPMLNPLIYSLRNWEVKNA
ncbi:olfactory receptor 5AL1-like [Cervus elaphus]|uniref:olfactory receptor 5AL1-like n=1 Tax=Cervus elaphus TaxID=9860 RepID=UPI001CC27A87|nr:olfactory receptor 5AL1-like [Cervus elaphus]